MTQHYNNDAQVTTVTTLLSLQLRCHVTSEFYRRPGSGGAGENFFRVSADTVPASMGLPPSLDSVVSGAGHSFDRAAALGSRVCPAVPVLFFGDLDAYLGSALRVVTVGLNPSLKEFPSDDPFLRFRLAENAGREDSGRYLEALSAYFRTKPYGEWFGNYEPLLNGMGASYYNGATSRVLHTDICSPVATDPTWSHLSETDRAVLVDDGAPLWHELLEVLQPSVVVLSVAREHLGRIMFDPLAPWGLIHRFDYTADGALRARPYEAEGCWYVVGDEPSLFVFCPASQTPLGLISHNHRHELGSIVADTYLRGW